MIPRVIIGALIFVIVIVINITSRPRIPNVVVLITHKIFLLFSFLFFPFFLLFFASFCLE